MTADESERIWPQIVSASCGAVAGRRPAKQQRDRESVDALGQVGQEPQRVQIDPLAVVDRHQHRPLVGEVHQQPVQAVQRREARLSGRWRLLVEYEQPRRRTGRAGKQIATPRGFGDNGVEQLAHHPERKRLLEL